MKKLLLSFLSVLVWLSIVNAQPTPITDLFLNGSLITGDQTDVAGPWAVFAFKDQTYTLTDAADYSELGVGTKYTDIGHAVGTDLRDANNSTITTLDGFSSNWNVWVEWNVSAQVTSAGTTPVGDIYYVSYTDGTLNAYLASTDWSFGTDQSSLDDTIPSRMIPLFSAHVDTANSTGYIIYDPNDSKMFRNASINFQIDTINNVGMFSPTVDLSELVNKNWLFALSTESAASGLSNWTTDPNTNTLAISSSGTGSVQFAYTPEPTTIIMMGFGLGVIGFVGRKIRE